MAHFEGRRTAETVHDATYYNAQAYEPRMIGKRLAEFDGPCQKESVAQVEPFVATPIPKVIQVGFSENEESTMILLSFRCGSCNQVMLR